MGLSVVELSARYGQAKALDGVCLEVGPGEAVGILGLNGAGKTTLLRSIAGLHRNRSGSILLDGVEASVLRADQIACRGLAFLREGGQLPASLTVAQNLELGRRLARARGRAPQAVDEVLNWFPLLAPLMSRSAGLLSGGQRQALALAMALASRPSLILLDEPSAGLAPPVARELFATIARITASGIPTLIVEQYAAWLQGLVHRVYLLELGKVTAQGSLADVTAARKGALE